MVRIYVVRHGETEANRQEIVQGQLDTELNDAGIGQAEMVAAALKEIPFDLAYSSDLSRAAKTAAIIMAHHPHVPIRQQAGLRERNFGALQGKTYTQKRSTSAVNFNSDPTAESTDVFTKRALHWWDGLVADCGSTRSGAQNVLAVSHGGFIITLVKALLARGKMSGSDAEGDYIEMDGTARLVRYGDISHLDGKFKVLDRNVDVQP
ncbi:phosphoglycerate mutase-like protein [Hymenopellis radicata]|nr:phosphoglycerate mutase-like protein [Hymenopellis radicata]